MEFKDSKLHGGNFWAHRTNDLKKEVLQVYAFFPYILNVKK